MIGLVLLMESGSVILQMISKRWFGKKIFLVAPLHHHFEARGWPSQTVTMRFWMIAGVSAFVGVIIALADPTFVAPLLGGA